MPSRSRLALLAALPLLAACGDTLVDHGGISFLGDPTTCGEGQVVCGGVCTTQSELVCGTGCIACPAAPAHASESCTPIGPGGHDGVCGFQCDDGLLPCASVFGAPADACCAPALVAAGGEFSCATTTTGEVHCFGAGDQGQLGNATVTDRSTASHLRGFTQPATALVAGGAHACALSGGATLCWGNGAAFGVSGNLTDPEAVPSLAGATKLAAGKSHTCGIVGGQVRCVGADASAGGGSPSLAAGTVLAITAGDRFSCALVNTGGGNVVQCWGAEDFGQTGRGIVGTSTATPITVGVVPTTVQHVAAGARHACAGTETGDNQTLFCWGSNDSRQLGDDPNTLGIWGPTLNTKVKKPILAISGGGHATCAVESDAGNRILSCWSSDPLVAGGIGAVTGEPNEVVASAAPYAFSAGDAHTCFVDTFVTPTALKCFGVGARGRLGNGDTVNSAAPVPVVGR